MMAMVVLFLERERVDDVEDEVDNRKQSAGTKAAAWHRLDASLD
jgi:hypothetical protein